MPAPTIVPPETVLAALAYKAARTAEIEAALKACRPQAYNTVFVWFSARLGQIEITAKFAGHSNRDGRAPWETERSGTDFDALCAEVLADIAAYREQIQQADVERMAIAIIQIKHREGTVTDRALRLADFTQDVIETVHARAAALANEMSDGKPFEVVFDGASNQPATVPDGEIIAEGV